MRREAAALLEVIWDPDAAPVTDPVEALQRLGGQVQHAADVLGARLDTAELDGPTALAWSRTLRELRLTLDGMARLGLAEREIELQQHQAELVVVAFRLALDAVQLVPADRSEMTRAFLSGLGRGPDRPVIEVVRGEVE